MIKETYINQSQLNVNLLGLGSLGAGCPDYGCFLASGLDGYVYPCGNQDANVRIPRVGLPPGCPHKWGECPSGSVTFQNREVLSG